MFTRKDKPITGSTIRMGLGIACRRAGIEGFTFHDLRRSFTTNMRRAGVHDLVIMAITGHKTMAMFQRYNSLSIEELKAAGKIGRRGDLYGDHAALETRNEEPGNG
jgi:integrase